MSILTTSVFNIILEVPSCKTVRKRYIRHPDKKRRKINETLPNSQVLLLATPKIPVLRKLHNFHMTFKTRPNEKEDKYYLQGYKD